VLVAVLGAIAITAMGAGSAGAQSGEIFVSGSSTVEPLTSLVAELYAEEAPDVQVRVDGPGTGDGFQQFCNDETDISDASRAIAEEEVAACESSGVQYTELEVAIDGLTIVVNKASTVKCLAFEDLYAIFGPESGGGEVDLADSSALATELGNSKSPKRGTVEKFTPGPESGTYDSFIEISYEDIMETRLEEGAIPADKLGTNDEGEQEVIEPQISAGTFPNDNETVKRVEGADNGIGYFGFAYFEENKGGDIKPVAIVNPETGKCVKPTRKTIQQGTYPIARPLFIYPNNAKVAANSDLKDFLDFYMTEDTLTRTVTQSGYVPSDGETRAAAIEAWEASVG
jgi:phosphate transport system substrate-binding protein